MSKNRQDRSKELIDQLSALQHECEKNTNLVCINITGVGAPKYHHQLNGNNHLM